MDRVLELALASMQHDVNRLESVAHNLANATTPGYKRQVVAHPSFGEVFAAASTDAGAAPPGDAEARVLTDMRAGTVRITEQPLDLAIEGDGWFEVVTEGGPAYTRQGDFRIDARGRLVTVQGLPVMGKGGEIVLTSSRPVVDASGNVTEPGMAGTAAAQVGQLRIVRLPDAGAARRLGGGLFSSAGAAVPVADGEVAIRQGALENANVSSMHEMVRLMETMRHFESLQKVAQGYDEMLGAAVRTIGELS